MPELINKLRSILTSSQKKKFGWLIVIVIVMAIFEVVGIASIMPFMQLVSQPDAIEENKWLAWAYRNTGLNDPMTFLFAVGAFVLSLLAARNVTALAAKWMQHRFAWSSAHSLAMRLLKAYVYQPYEFFLQSNSSNLGKQVLTEVNLFVRFILLPCADIVAQTCVSVVILALLVAVDPKLALTVFVVLGGVYAGIYAVTRRFMGVIGRERFEADRVRFKTANELLSGIKSVKIRGCEGFFVGRFETASRHYTTVQPKYDILSQAPRHFVELLAFGGILLIILFLLARAEAVNDVIPVLSLYALAGFRLLPALQHLFKSVTSLRFHAPAVDSIYQDLRDAEAQATASASEAGVPMSSPTSWIKLADVNGSRDVKSSAVDHPLTFERQITVRDVAFQFMTSEEPTLDGVNLVVPRHAHVAIVGPTGSGKTTLVDLLIGLLKPTRGEILVDGVPITHTSVKKWREMLGYVPQDVVLYDATFARNIAYGVPDSEMDMARVRRAAEIACVDEFISKLSDGYETKVGERGVRMSGGQRQRIGLARSLYHEPDVLILDEATNSLDGITEEAVLLALSETDHRMTIITIAHRLATVRGHDHIYLLDKGRIAAEGTYEELVTTSDTFRKMAKLTA